MLRLVLLLVFSIPLLPSGWLPAGAVSPPEVFSPESDRGSDSLMPTGDFLDGAVIAREGQMPDPFGSPPPPQPTSSTSPPETVQAPGSDSSS